MSDLFLPSERQMARIEPYFPLAHGVPRVDDRRVISGIVYVLQGNWHERTAGVAAIGADQARRHASFLWPSRFKCGNRRQ